MKKKLLSVLLCICMVCTLLPATALAAVAGASVTNYDLKVGGVQVTAGNANSITGDSITAGTVSYDPDSNTLTLNNATIAYPDQAISTSSNDLIIKLVGNNSVSGTDNNGNSTYGMYINGDLSFTGDGSLTASAATATAGNSWSVAILAKGNITINNGCTITVTCGTAANTAAPIYPYGGEYQGNDYISHQLILNGAKVETASANADGSDPVADPGSSTLNLRSYKYLKIVPDIPAATPNITAQAIADATYARGATDVTVLSITVEAPSDGGSLSYQWYINTTNSYDGGERIGTEDAQSASYTPPTDAALTRYYYCVVTNTKDGMTATTKSSIAKITVSQNYQYTDVNGATAYAIGLLDAMQKAKDNTTITVMDDTTETEAIKMTGTGNVSEKELTIDLNGWTVECSEPIELACGSLKLTNTATSGSGTYKGDILNAGGSLTIEKITVTGEVTMQTSTTGTLDINSGSINQLSIYSSHDRVSLRGGTFTNNTQAITAYADTEDNAKMTLLGLPISGKKYDKADSDIQTGTVESNTHYARFAGPVSVVDSTPKPVITQQPISATYTKGAQAAALTVEATVTDGTLSYKWLKIGEGEAAPVVANTPSFIPPTDTVGTVTYVCHVINTIEGLTNSTMSNEVTITVTGGNTGGNTGSTSSSGGSYTPPTYKVESEVAEETDGSVSLSTGSAKKGDTVTITVTPDTYYQVEDVIVKDSSGKIIEVTENKDGTFSFQMPASKVTVEPVFSWDNPFTDVNEDAYYAPAVEWALKNSVTGGTTAETFAPGAACTRAQMVTFLWRAAGCPEPTGAANPFTDIDEDSYYTKAVLWALEQGITGGTTAATFSPYNICTRAQMATFLCRMEDGEAEGTVNPFADVPDGAYFAAAVQWAAENGITNGTGNGTTFSPNATCTRGQMVTFLYRYFAD